METESKTLIRQLMENMEALKSKTAFPAESPEEEIPHFGSSNEPDMDEVLHSSSSTPAVSSNVQFGYRAPEAISLVFSDLRTKYDEVTLSAIGEESEGNQPLREILSLQGGRISVHDLLSIFPIQLDQPLSLEDFESFVNSAKDFLNKDKILQIDVYGKENKEEID